MSKTLSLILALSLSVVACSNDESGSEHGDDAGTGKAQAVRGRLFVTLAGPDQVVVIDEETQEIESEIDVGKGPAIILATPDHTQVFTANWEDNSVSAIDVASEDMVNIALPGRPYVIAMAPQGDFVYAGLDNNTLVAIGTESHAVEKTFTTKVLAASIVVSADGKTLYVASLNSVLPGKLEALSAEDGSVVGSALTVGIAPAWITMSPNGKYVYTLNFLSDDVSVVDTAAWKLVTPVSTGKGSLAIIGNVTPDNSRLYVTNHGTAELMAIDTKKNEPVQTIDLDGRPVGVQFNLDGSRVYVTDFGTASLARSADTNFLLTGKFSTNDPGQVSIFDTKTGKQVGNKVAVGAGATSVVFIPN